jgi:hypothetical protein
MDLPLRTDIESSIVVRLDTNAYAHVDGLDRRLGHKTALSTEAGSAVQLLGRSS